MREMRLQSRTYRRPALALLAWACLGSAQAASFLGIVYPLTDVTLSVQVAGVVSKTDVRVGERVIAGQNLLKLAAAPQETEVKRRTVMAKDRSAIKSGEQRLQILQSMLMDAEKLLQSGGVISHDEVRKLRLELATVEGDLAAAKADHERQQLDLKLAQVELDQYVLRAPVSGVITDFEPAVGEWVAPGDAIIRLVNAAVCEVRVKVSPAAAAGLKRGQTLRLQIQDPSGAFAVNGQVSFVSPVADAASSLVDVRVRVTNKEDRIRAGSKATLNVGVGN